jgi:hypothetical protein
LSSPFSDDTSFNAMDVCDSGGWFFHREYFIRHL